MPFFLVNNTQLKSGRTLKTSYVVSSVNTSRPVRLPLRPSLSHLYVTLSRDSYSLRLLIDSTDVEASGISRDCTLPDQPRRPCGAQVPRLHLSPHAAVITPGSRSLRFPIDGMALRSVHTLHDRHWPSPKT